MRKVFALAAAALIVSVGGSYALENIQNQGATARS